MSDTPAVLTRGLHHRFGTTAVLDGVDLAVPQGSIYALLGPNGAGKTTMVRILTTLLRPDAGHAVVAGFDVRRQRRQLRRSISLTGQFPAVDGLQTGLENLIMMGRLSGISRSAARARAGELLDRFTLTGAANRRVATYSGGMRRRLDIAASLVGRPSVIFLDEPTTGLDLPSRNALWQTISELTRDGVTVLLTTQYLEEADRMADRIAVLTDGRIAAEGTAAELKERVAGHRLDIVASDAAAFDELRAILGDRALSTDTGTLVLQVPCDGTAARTRDLLDDIDPDRRRVRAFSVHGATIDDVFLALTVSAPAPSTN